MKIEINEDQYEQIRQALITAEIALANVAADMKIMKLDILHQFRLAQSEEMSKTLNAIKLSKLNVNYL